MTYKRIKKQIFLRLYIILYIKKQKTIDFCEIVCYILYGKNIGIDREWGDPLS